VGPAHAVPADHDAGRRAVRCQVLGVRRRPVCLPAGGTGRGGREFPPEQQTRAGLDLLSGGQRGVGRGSCLGKNDSRSLTEAQVPAPQRTLSANRPFSLLCHTAQVIDAADYATIHVQEMERQVLDVAVDDVDLYVSVVEGSGAPMGPFSADDAICRLYEVGRRRPDEADSDLDDAHSSDEEDDEWAGEEEEDDESGAELVEDEDDDENEDGDEALEGLNESDLEEALAALSENDEEREGDGSGEESSADSASSESDGSYSSDGDDGADDALAALLMDEEYDEDDDDSDYSGSDDDN